MKRNVIIIGLLLVLCFAGLGFLAVNNSKDSSGTEPRAGTTQPPAASSKQGDEPTPAAADSGYIEYSEEAIAKAEGDKYLFFHAPWCPQCRSIESGIVSDGVPAGVTIIKVDYDSNQQLRQKYGVTLQTTFVKVDKNGNFESKYVAYDDPHFSSVVRDYIKM